jgi:hypothetical protein
MEQFGSTVDGHIDGYIDGYVSCSADGLSSRPS